MKKVCFGSFLFVLSFLCANGQKISQEEYISRYKDLAIQEMIRSGVPASITLAQGLLETDAGNSPLLLRSNNHFGIKCKSNWNGPSVSHDDDERDECFRAYTGAEESYRDHSDFLRNSPRYAFLFDLEITDYKGWAEGLRKAGYATNPRYPEILIRYVETYNLQQFDTFSAPGTMLANVQLEPAYEIIPASMQHQIPEQTFLPFSNHVINDLKALYVTGGTSLLAIATRFNIKLSRLLEYNDLQKDGILPSDQFIFLERKKSQGASAYYTTTKSESIYEIAQKTGVQLQSLLDYNRFSADKILPAGSKVFLREANMSDINAKTTAATGVDQSRKPAAMIVHKVQPKEGLYSISKQYGVSVEELKEWNKLANDNLQIGQSINIMK